MNVLTFLFFACWFTIATVWTLISGGYVSWQAVGIFWEVCLIGVIWMFEGSEDEDDELLNGKE